ncbi:tetratricopeptide repeat protein [bacterium]|nr:tetratricopeptide repeat protein [bacterium]
MNLNKKQLISYLLIALLLVLAFIKSPFYNSEKLVEFCIKTGIEEYKAGFYDLANLNYRIALLIDPKSAWAYNAMGTSYYYRAKSYYILNSAAYKNYQKAIQSYNKAIELEPDYYFAFVNRGNCYERLGEYKIALKDYEKALTYNKNDPDALYGLAMVYSSKDFKQYDKAIESLKKLVELRPNHENAYFGLGWCYDLAGDYVNSIRSYQKLAELNPNRIDVWINLSYTSELKLKDYKNAVYYADRALQLNPNALYAISNKGYALIGLKKYDEAMFYVNKQLAIDPKHSRAYLQKGQIELAKGNKNNAKKYFEQALKYEKESNFSDKDYIIEMLNNLIQQCK